MAMADGFLPHRGFVDGLKGEGHLDELFVGGVGCHDAFSKVLDF